MQPFSAVQIYLIMFYILEPPILLMIFWGFASSGQKVSWVATVWGLACFFLELFTVTTPAGAARLADEQAVAGICFGGFVILLLLVILNVVGAQAKYSAEPEPAAAPEQANTPLGPAAESSI